MYKDQLNVQIYALINAYIKTIFPGYNDTTGEIVLFNFRMSF